MPFCECSRDHRLREEDAIGSRVREAVARLGPGPECLRLMMQEPDAAFGLSDQTREAILGVDGYVQCSDRPNQAGRWAAV